MYDVVTLGECMAVLYPTEPVTMDHVSTLTLDIAGAESNTAIGLSQLGHRVRFVSQVGNDSLGQRIRSTLAREGVDTTYLLTDAEAQTGVFFREWLPDGARRVQYYRRASAASRLSPGHLKSEMFAGARIVHMTGITPALSETCAASVARAIELAHEVGALVSFDPNYRAPLWSVEAARTALLPLMSQADILLMGHEDAHAILGTHNEEEVLAPMPGFRAQVVVLKQAEKGACARAGETRVTVPAMPVAEVIDPVGAGDGFNAGFLSGWLRGYALEDALLLGAQVGAKIVSLTGDYIHSRDKSQLVFDEDHQ